LLDPEPEHVLGPAPGDAEREGDGLALDGALVPDLDPEGIEQHHRIAALQRPLLPGGDLLEHLIGDAADQVGRDMDLVELF
jgi:hypothetical protein